MNRPYPGLARPAESGVALIIALALVALVTVLVAVLLSLSKGSIRGAAASASHSDVQSFTRSVANLIVTDFRNELIASSTNLPSLPTAGAPATIRSPQSAGSLSSAVPYRTISSAIAADAGAANFSNLVAQSVASTPLFPTSTAPYNSTTGLTLALPTGASAISSATPSLNNRFISGSRWSTPQLLMNSAQFSNAEVPNWVYVTRAGVPATQTFTTSLTDGSSSNANFVIGRFAFNVYDVSGLLDINSAGYDPSTAAADAPLKGALAWADLTALPGVTSTMVQQFVDWRNPVGITNYLTTIQNWLGPQGFLLPYQGASTGDRFFVTRQDLLSYQAAHPTVLPATVLPFLTHWTRTIDTPSYAPNLSRPLIGASLAGGGNDGYNNDDLINPNVNQLCDSAGTPVMRERFPLSRLNLVANNITIPSGPVASNATNILSYFGLQWNPSNASWTYLHGDNNTGNRILRLSEIPQSGGHWSREPDFFEVLKAAICAGSLGKQWGIQTIYGSVTNYGTIPSTDIHARGNQDGEIDYHVMRIGACIIDQYGSQSYPTHISFDGIDVFGLKNLPYLYYPRVFNYPTGYWPLRPAGAAHPGWYVLANTTSGVAPGTKIPAFTSMLQPTLWNPHAPPTTTLTGPTTFRVVVDSGGVGCQMQAPRYSPPGGTSADYSAPTMEGPNLSSQLITYTPTNAYLQFNITATGAASFREPRSLCAKNYPSGANTTSWPDNPDYNPADANPADSSNNACVGTVDTVINATTYSEWATAYNPDPVPAGTLSYLGFKLGVYPSLATVGADKQYVGPPQRMILEYLGPDGNYYPYDAFDTSIPSIVFWNSQMYHFGGRFDPRSDRWGLDYSYYADAAPSSFQPNRSLRPCSQTPSAGSHFVEETWTICANTSGSGWFPPSSLNSLGVALGDLQWNNTQVHTTGVSPVYYTDPDGVLRTADGAAESNLGTGETGLPMTTVAQDAGALGASPPPATNPDYSSRPVILNRPFRSVAELGYAFRDEAWKSLDFWTAQSGDSALLDYFTLYEPSTPVNVPATLTPLNPVVAGCLSPNGPHPEVYQAVIQGTAKASGVNITTAEAQAVAQALVSWTTSTAAGKGPFQNRAELVGKYIGTGRSAASSSYSGFMSSLTTQLTGTDPAIKARRESVLRALSDSCNTRTWNFMIDIIGQTGRFPTQSTSLDQFEVSGEARFWLFVAIDRYTGKITDSSLELVNE